MRRKIWMTGFALLTGVMLLATSAGCNERFWLSNVASFSTGWLLRDFTMPATTETLCYRNGELVDCSEVLP